MDWQSLWHWIYVAGMALGAFYFWTLSRNPRGVPQYEYLVAIFIPVWSGLAYTAMAVGQGKIGVADQVTHYARYADWIVTTPLLLLALAWTAMAFTKKDGTLIGALMGTQVIVIVCGLIADLSTNQSLRYLWYINGTVAFLLVLQMIWGPLRAKTRSQQPELATFYHKLATYFTVLWIGYPLVWIIGPSGFGWINQDVETFLFCLLPFFSKVGFSFIDLHGLRDIYSNHHSHNSADRFAASTFEFLGFSPIRRNRRGSLGRRSRPGDAI